MTSKEFKEKYFTNSFYWVNESNYERLQHIGIKYGCVNPNGDCSIIEWHNGFNCLGFRTYEKNNFVTRFQKEPFLTHNEEAVDYEEMIRDYESL